MDTPTAAAEIPDAETASQGAPERAPKTPAAASQKPDSFLGLLREFWSHMHPRHRLALVLLSTLNVVASLCQLAFATLVAAFVGAALAPAAMQGNAAIQGLSALLGLEADFFLVLGIAIVALAILNTVLTLSVGSGNVYFSWLLNRDVSVRLLDSYLQQELLFFKRRNSAELAKSTLVDVQTACGSFILPLLEASSRLTLVATFGVLLIVIDPLLALGVIAMLAAYYGASYRLLHRRLDFLGREKLRTQNERFVIAMELFSTIREAKLHHQEATFLGRYRAPTDWYCRINAIEATLAHAPRLFLEAFGVVALVVMVLSYTQGGGGMASLAPVLALYSVAAYRLMPAVQLLFFSAAQVRASTPLAHSVMHDLRLAETSCFSDPPPPAAPLPFHHAIELRSLSFSYEPGSRAVLDDISLVLPKHAFTAICGHTGSGKSTLLDIVAGLLEPNDGALLVDGRRLEEGDRRAWQLNFSYVPQEVVLLDASIRSNIAFGIPDRDIDDARVAEAARLAEIDDFIVGELPMGYATVVGERGSRLSGGQRQRIGIARALYRDPEILLLDEATSALDTLTETRVVANVRRQRRSRTIVAITHRVFSVRDADRIHVLEGGRLVASGRYDDLCATNAKFKSLATERTQSERIDRMTSTYGASGDAR
jgi:ABC-type bacteriocin/lantibiotic exporter with double-glycine peptidase domain